MNSFKFVSMFVGVIAAAAIATSPLAAFAQDAPPQNQPTQARPRIVLSEQQQAKFQAIQETAIASIEKVLNPEQQKQFAAGRENGQGLGAIQNLSDAQKGEIITILRTANSEIGDILTAEQKQEIQRSMSNQPQPQQR
jgi:Spy/CpxP family protein refolding chaperone